MVKHINLLHKNREYEAQEKRFYYLRTLTLIACAVGFLLVSIMFIAKSREEKQYSQLLTTKEQYLHELLSIKEDQEKIAYVDSKADYLNKIVIKDANFAPYYNLLKQTLFDSIAVGSSDSAEVKRIHFDNKQSIELQINLYSDAALNAYLTTLESEQFLSQFQKFELIGFKIMNSGSSYETIIKAIFKPIKNKL